MRDASDDGAMGITAERHDGFSECVRELVDVLDAELVAYGTIGRSGYASWRRAFTLSSTPDEEFGWHPLYHNGERWNTLSGRYRSANADEAILDGMQWLTNDAGLAHVAEASASETVSSVFDDVQGRDRTPTGPADWSCPGCGSSEVLARWEAMGNQLGIIAADGRFQATAEEDVYECEPWSVTCAYCDEPVPDDRPGIAIAPDGQLLGPDGQPLKLDILLYQGATAGRTGESVMRDARRTHQGRRCPGPSWTRSDGGRRVRRPSSAYSWRSMAARSWSSCSRLGVAVLLLVVAGARVRARLPAPPPRPVALRGKPGAATPASSDGASRGALGLLLPACWVRRAQLVCERSQDGDDLRLLEGGWARVHGR